MIVDGLTLAGVLSTLPLLLFVLLRGSPVCDQEPECEGVPAHLRDMECCPAD